MRVAIVTNIPTPYRKGFFSELTSHRDIELTVFYCAPSEADRHWGDQTGLGYNYKMLPGFSPSRNLHVNPSVGWELARGGFDVVVVGGYSYPSAVIALLAARALDIPAVMWLDGAVGKAHGVFMKRILLGMVHAFIVTSSRVVESLSGLGVCTCRTRVIPLTVDVGFWTRQAEKPLPEQVRVALDAYGNTRMVTYCGRFVPAKNIDFVIELAYRLQDLQDLVFLMIGDGPLRLPSSKKASELAIRNLVFTGRVAPSELPPVFGASDILILPSLYEPWGAVVNEALAMGTPVMVSSIAGAADLITPGENGYIIDPTDVAGAERILRAYLSDADRQVVMGRNALRTGLQLTHEMAARGFAEALRLWVG